ncbi:MAG: UDP-N-acetylmuramate dehydrogenase [Clostridiales bacterium]|nr:UDP-N-acetylmuramate dehydrogenase [Clostridiales bacterium]
MTIRRKLTAAIADENIFENEPMAGHTSFKAGGCADLLVVPQSMEELKAVLQTLSGEDAEYVILGNGSNILVRDGGYRGIIVKIGDAFNHTKADGRELVCGAGTLMSVVSKAAVLAELSGLEFASGIPGTIGGAVFMNAGAYGGETSQILKEARLVSRDGREEFCMTAEELQMGYRHTLLHETGHIVTEVVLRLEEGREEEIREKIADFTGRRNSKQPVTYPSAGSFFKRPEGYFAGTLIQDAGLKGLTVGGAQVSELHAGFIINKGGATAADILQLMEIVQAEVLDKYGVKLEPEVRIIGESV